MVAFKRGILPWVNFFNVKHISNLVQKLQPWKKHSENSRNELIKKKEKESK